MSDAFPAPLEDPDLWIGNEPEEYWVRIRRPTAERLVEAREIMRKKRLQMANDFGCRMSETTLSDVVAFVVMKT